MKINIFLIISFIVVIFGVGLSQTGVEVYNNEKPQFLDIFMQKPTKDNLREFEDNLEKGCRFSQKLRKWTQYLQFVLLKDTGEKAVPGKNNWLFYRPGVRYLIEPLETDDSPGGRKDEVISAVVSFRNQLAARGIQLLVVPAPGKASIYPGMLTSRATGTDQPVYIHTLEIISNLKEAGIEVVNLFEIFSRAGSDRTDDNSKRYYLSRDTHWSPEGMRAAAKITAQRIIDQGWVERGTVDYDLKPVMIERYGDILRMMNAPKVERSFIPEKINCTQVVRRDNGEPYKDEQRSEVLVLGDSFLRIYEQDEPGSGGFIAHLAHELKFPFTSIVNDGGASTLVRQYLSRKPELLENKKVVIWEFVERDIRFGMEGWQEVSIGNAKVE